VVCDIMLPAVLAITHTLTTYYNFFRSGSERVNTPYRTSGVAENLGRYFSCAKHTTQGKDFKLILTVTRRAAVYLGTHCNIGSKRAFPTGVLDR